MINLGDKVKDKVSGLVGIVVTKLEHLNGCVQYAVTPPMKKGSTEMPSWNIDEEQLELADKKTVKVKKSRDGGPTTKAVSQR